MIAVVAPEAIILLSGDRYVGAIPIVGFALVLQIATAAVMVALFVTVSAVVTEPSGYFTVTKESMGFCQAHLS